MADDTQFQRLRKERNIAAVAAVLFIVVSMALSVPPALKRRNELKQTNDLLLGLQAAIVDTQAKLKKVQADITQTQQEIERALKSH